MSKIRDLPNYNKMVPHVKSVNIYETINHKNVKNLIYITLSTLTIYIYIKPNQ
jgi:hypothetical protein